ncbi:restriction endonuclease subunit S [Methylobacter svalbardensis]|uniref:restriction endonuclease subunit S n=1 Tax=Methylobacter svalbardensis TaxID=3080016 RepID=UPI0030EDAFAB
MSWNETVLESIIEVVTKGTTPTTYGMPFTDEGVNFVKAEALNGDVSLERSGFTFITEATHEKLKRSQLAKDDVLITIAGANVGKCGFVREEDLPANTNQAVGIVRVDPEKALPRFVYYHFKNPSTFTICQSFGGQAAQPNINLTVLKGMKLKLPNIPIQEKIVDLLSSYDELIKNNRRRIQLLEDSARLLYQEWFVYLRFPGHEHVRIVDGVPEGWSKEPLENLLILQRGFDLPSNNRVDGSIPIYASTGVNGFHNQAKVKGPGVVTGRSGSLGTVMYVSKDHWPLNTALWVKGFKKVGYVIVNYGIFYFFFIK